MTLALVPSQHENNLILEERHREAMNPDYCSCNEFEKALNYNDIKYYRPEDDRFNAVKKAGWYIYSLSQDRPVANLEPFRYCPWCAKKLTKPWPESVKSS